MGENNLKVDINDNSEIRREVSTKKASIGTPMPKKNKINSSVLATKDSFIMESLSVAWNLLRWRPWYVTVLPILVSLLASLTIIVPMFLIGMLMAVALIFVGKNVIVAMIVGVIVLFLLGLFIYLFLKFVLPASMFQYIFIRDLLLGKSVNVKETFKSLMDWGLVGRFFGGTLLLVLIVIGGLILFIIPGVIWMIKYMFVPLLILDKKMGARESLEASGEMTDGYKWPLFAYALLVGIIGFGLLGSILGSLIIAPIYLISYIFIYLVFSGQVQSVKQKTTKAPAWQIVSLVVVSILLQILNIVGNSTGGK